MMRTNQAEEGRSGLLSWMSGLSLSLCLLLPWSTARAQQSQDSSGLPGRQVFRAQGEITRLTHSGNHVIGAPSISHDGQIVVYQEEARDTSTQLGETFVTRFVKRIMADGQGEEVLFRDSTLHAPAPYQEALLVMGTKPPLISGNGKKVIFSLSATWPHDMRDHFLGIVSGDQSGLRVIECVNEHLASLDWKKKKFTSQTWERIVTYGISDDGEIIACVVKGHLGPVACGVPGAILVMDGEGGRARSFLAPRLRDDVWTWDGFPRKPLIGGGWTFALSGDGNRILFGAQCGDSLSDYDLYLVDSSGGEPRRLTQFADRLFNLGDLSDDGSRIVFFYSGTKAEGAGTYRVDADGTHCSRLCSQQVSRLDADDMSGNGQWVVFKGPIGGWALDLDLDQETLLFDSATPGYVRSGVEMDFPSYPSFWAPRLLSRDGRTVLLSGVPVGKSEAELYVLRIRDMNQIKLVCPRCGNRMESFWQFCPYDGNRLR